MAADWTSLPLDLLATIALKLESCEDFIYFSSTCRCWNCASSLIKHEWRPPVPVPWLLLTENHKENPNFVRKIFNPTNNKCYRFHLPETYGRRCWGSAYGWIAMMDSDLNVKLFNPITKAQIAFPSLKTMLTAQVEYDEAYDESQEQYIYDHFKSSDIKLFVIKVSQSDDVHHDNEFAIVALCTGYRYLCFAKHTDQSWTSLSINESAAMHSVMRVGDHVFALNDRGTIVYWDIKKFHTIDNVIKPMDYSPGDPVYFWNKSTCCLGKTYLAKSGSDLLVVLRDVEEVVNSEHPDGDSDAPYRTLGFDLFNVDPKDKTLVKVEDLGEAALFLNSNFSLFVSGPLAKGLRPNFIYFVDDEPEQTPTEGFGYDSGVYDIKSGEIEQFYKGDDTRSSLCPPFLFIPHF